MFILAMRVLFLQNGYGFAFYNHCCWFYYFVYCCVCSGPHLSLTHKPELTLSAARVQESKISPGALPVAPWRHRPDRQLCRGPSGALEKLSWFRPGNLFNLFKDQSAIIWHSRGDMFYLLFRNAVFKVYPRETQTRAQGNGCKCLCIVVPNDQN